MEKITLQIATFLAKQLDKLKVKGPIVFLAVQGILVMLAGAFVQGTFHIDTPAVIAKWVDINAVLTTLFVALVALIGPRTSQLVAEDQVTKELPEGPVNPA
jgi:hypothetical protein